MKAKILIVDDDAPLRELLAEELNATGNYRVIVAAGAQEALELLGQEAPQVVVSDLRMPGQSGTDLCREIVSLRPDIPVIIMTAFGTMDTAVAAIRAGAFDFLTKPFESEQLELVLARALEDSRLRAEIRSLRRAQEETPGFAQLIGTSASMQRLFDLIERVASSDAAVLVQGESGTGKELVARALHTKSRRRAASFVPLNCAGLAETGLFHEGLQQALRGESGEPGTLFLDEVADLPLGLQAQLLRLLQQRGVELLPQSADEMGAPTGASGAVQLRVIAATQRNLVELVAQGKFRKDLYYRLNVISLEVPPLRERKDDVLLLAEVFFDQLSAREGGDLPTLSPRVLRALQNYDWPGNVRELKNCVERCAALALEGKVDWEQLPAEVQAATPEALVVSDEAPVLLAPLAEIEKRHVLRVMAAVNGNKSKAAQVLKIDRKTLHTRLQRYEYEDSIS